MVAEGALERGIARFDKTLEQDLRAGRGIQPGQCAVPDPCTRTPQQAGELVLREGVGHRRHRGQHRRRIGPDRHQQREGLAGMCGPEVGEIQRAAAVLQPAHDDPVAVQQLLAVDRDVLPWLTRATRDHQAEGDEPGDVAGPAALDRQAAQVDVVPF